MNARVFLLLLALYRVDAQGDGRSSSDLPSPRTSRGWRPRAQEYRWVVSIYKNKGEEGFQHICGGSLVRDDVVLTAAHCFMTGENKTAAEFRVTAGNLYRDMSHSEFKQVLEVEEIVVHERYRGQELKLAHDIALVKLKGKVDLCNSSLISIDFNKDFEDKQLKQRLGTVVGWGFTELNVPSETRMAVNLPYVDFDKCWTTIPRAFRSYLTPDKFCAGLRNGTSVCRGDSGGGLAFRHNGVWYVRGILSNAPQPEGGSQCATMQLSAYTSVSSYVLWLQKNLADMKEDNSHPEILCTNLVSKDPEHGGSFLGGVLVSNDSRKQERIKDKLCSANNRIRECPPTDDLDGEYPSGYFPPTERDRLPYSYPSRDVISDLPIKGGQTPSSYSGGDVIKTVLGVKDWQPSSYSGGDVIKTVPGVKDWQPSSYPGGDVIHTVPGIHYLPPFPYTTRDVISTDQRDEPPFSYPRRIPHY